MPSPKSIIQKKTDVRADLPASCANEQPCATNPPALGIGPLSRGRFIGKVGGVTAAAWTASAIGLSPLLGSKSVKAEAATVLGRQRAIEAYDLRSKRQRRESIRRFRFKRIKDAESLNPTKIENYPKGRPPNKREQGGLSRCKHHLPA